MAARRRCSLWPGHSGGVERARGTIEASSSCYEPNALKIKRNGQKREGFDTAELSNEVVLTPARDCGFAEGFHLGRARAGAYRGEGEHNGGLGTENGPLARPAASGGASAGNGAAAVTAAAAALASGEGEGAGEWTEWCLGARGAVPTGVSRSASGASTTPAYGRNVAGVGWSKAGARARERGEGRPGRTAWLGRKGGGRPSSACPLFLFFEFLFSKKLKYDF